jgi:hypothetical protein
MNMRNKKRSGLSSQVALASALVLAGIGLAGCSSTPHLKNDAAARSMQSAAAEVQAESQALELTMGALKDLMQPPQGDLKVPYQHYITSLERLISAARGTEQTGQRMADKNAAYLHAWDKELAAIQYEHVRDLSQARKAEVTSRFEAIQRRYQDNQDVVEPLLSYLQDIRKALRADLTAAGVASMKSVAQNADTNAAKVQTALAALNSELNNSGTLLSSVVPQAVQP